MFQGLSAFPITPADPDGRVKTDELAGLVERLVVAKVDSIGLLGSTGSYMYLAREERKRAVAAAVEAVKGRTPIIVGAGAMRTDEAVRLAKDAEEAGADGLLLAPVSYTPLRDEEVFRHFAAVAGATGLPVCIYNNPSTTHFIFSDALIARLAAVPRIAAVKNPGLPAAEIGPRHAALRAMVPAEFAIGYSGDWHASACLLAGGVGWYSVIGGLLPEPTLKLARAAAAGDRAEVERIEAAFAPLWDLFKQASSYRIVHAAAKRLGLASGDPPAPLLPPTAEEIARIEPALAALRTV
jgi:4-hydroxy-tetrahydrodipicolinate synthase